MQEITNTGKGAEKDQEKMRPYHQHLFNQWELKDIFEQKS